MDQEGAQAVFYHLKQKAAQKGLIKRVLYYQPFVYSDDGEKKVCPSARVFPRRGIWRRWRGRVGGVL